MIKARLSELRLQPSRVLCSILCVLPAPLCAVSMCNVIVAYMLIHTALFFFARPEGFPLTSCLFCVSAAVPKYASVRRAQKSSAVAGDRQHQPDRGLRPTADGRQRPQRPLRQVQDGPPEVQEQGTVAFVVLFVVELVAEPEK